MTQDCDLQESLLVNEYLSVIGENITLARVLCPSTDVSCIIVKDRLDVNGITFVSRGDRDQLVETKLAYSTQIATDQSYVGGAIRFQEGEKDI